MKRTQETTNLDPEVPPAGQRPRAYLRWSAALLAVAAIGAGVGWLGYDRHREGRLAEPVRRGFADRRYDEVRDPLRRWLEERPRSGEPHYFRAWLALVDDRPREVEAAVRRAFELGYDREALEVLQAIHNARAGQVNDAEPVLRRAYDRGWEPRAEVARELAGIYLKTYRLTQAAEVVERYRELMPADPRPYLWLNEIGGRTGALPAAMIRNYREALERDPELDRARLGLAEQLSKDRRFDEAAEEYRAYLRRHPRDAAVMVGLGRNAFQGGDIEGAARAYEAALEIDPRQADAIKELAQLDIRFGRFRQARSRLERLAEIEPFDPDVRYSYAQALKLAGEPDKARVESERAARLRADQERIVRLQSSILKNPGDLASRLEVARWMLGHGHDKEGLDWAREILRADPRHAPTHRALAEYYAGIGNPGLANYHRTMASGEPDGR